MKNRRDICQGSYDKKTAEKTSPDEQKMEINLKRAVEDADNYVKGPEKYGPHLGDRRWGQIPIIIRNFLNDKSKNCIGKTELLNNSKQMCLLRYGVQTSSTQSFISCIASAIFLGQKDNLNKDNKKAPLITRYIPDATSDIPTISEMKELLLKAINIDKYITYQNGNLVSNFATTEIEVNIDDYKDSKLYKKILNSKNEKENMDFLKKVIASYENFKRYLLDNKITIDYTYLWDIISMPNEHLFDKGINLIILEIPDDDASNNVELVCPTNHYSMHMYDARKRSLLLIKRGLYFEPVYGYKYENKTYGTQ